MKQSSCSSKIVPSWLAYHKQIMNDGMSVDNLGSNVSESCAVCAFPPSQIPYYNWIFVLNNGPVYGWTSFSVLIEPITLFIGGCDHPLA